ncbi:hypothetical protein [Mycobacteroides abscessus]|uniref:hypothetical protein n=1 Tax=Mycobacteroides abscessus TaxID=36809 RepID=UPI003FF03EE9
MVESGPSPYRWIGTNRSDVLRDCGGLLAVYDPLLNGIFRRAVAKSLLEWGWDEATYIDDFTQSMWEWYLENPSVQTKFTDLGSEGLVPAMRVLANQRAEQLLSKERYKMNLFEQKSLYSSDVVRKALRNHSTNKYLKGALPAALDALGERKQGARYVEAIRSRYVDGVVPKAHSEEMVLSRAVQGLTEEINAAYISSDVTGAGSSNAMYPEKRKRKGQHGDPTADLAIGLMEHGDDLQMILQSTTDRTVVAITTYRREFYGDEPVRRPVQRNATFRDV